MGYFLLQNSYLLGHGITILYQANRLRKYMLIKKEVPREDISDDWILCDDEEPDVIVL